jgi:hypothetical protein
MIFTPGLNPGVFFIVSDGITVIYSKYRRKRGKVIKEVIVMKKILIYELTNDTYHNCIKNECCKVDPSGIKTKVCIFADKISSITQDDMSNLKIVTDNQEYLYNYVPKHYGFKVVNEIIDFVDDSTTRHFTLYLGINVSNGSVTNLGWRL